MNINKSIVNSFTDNLMDFTDFMFDKQLLLFSFESGLIINVQTMKECSYKKDGQKKDNKTALGVILLIVGIVLLGRNLHFIPLSISHMLFSWPMLLIAIGLIMVSGKGKSVGGIFMIGLGGIFLWDKMMPFSPFEWKIVWPMLFIMVGAVLVVIYLGHSFKEINQSRANTQKAKFGKEKHRNVEFDIDKIEPIED